MDGAGRLQKTARHIEGHCTPVPAVVSRQEEPVEKTETLRWILTDSTAVIFDFDNIIVDSEPYHYAAYAAVFARYGHEIDREEYWREWTSRGGGAEGEIERYGLDLDPVEIRREKDPIYAEYCNSGTVRPFPTALDIIRAFKRTGYTLAIASGSYERDIRAILSAHGIEGDFGAVVGKDAIAQIKPHPETYLSAAAKINTPPGRCLAIEDAEKGIRSAGDAGMRVIVIETPITRGLPLDGGDLKFGDLEEFAALLRTVLPG
jgi:beta-phosphoglucomutase